MPVLPETGKTKIDALTQSESKLLALFFRYPELLDFYSDRLQKTGFVSPVRQSIYEKLWEMKEKTFSDIQEALFLEGDEAICRETARIIAESDRPVPKEVRVQAAEDCLRKMERSALQQEFEEHRRLAETYSSLNDARYIEELRICNELRGKITKLYGN